MRCSACKRNYSLSAWRVVNLNPVVKTTIRNSSTALRTKNPITYYSTPGKQQYSQMYACPYCGTVRIKTPIDRI